MFVCAGQWSNQGNSGLNFLTWCRNPGMNQGPLDSFVVVMVTPAQSLTTLLVKLWRPCQTRGLQTTLWRFSQGRKNASLHNISSRMRSNFLFDHFLRMRKSESGDRTYFSFSNVFTYLFALFVQLPFSSLSCAGSSWLPLPLASFPSFSLFPTPNRPCQSERSPKVRHEADSFEPAEWSERLP